MMGEKFEYVHLDRIEVQRNNVRVRDIDQGKEDLAANIKANGLLQPIAAYYDGIKSKYVILTGQRRLNAYHYLNEKYPNEGFDKIQCKVIDEPESNEKKKSLSLAENITQLPMANLDLMKAVTDLYNVYGDYEMVQQEFGITKRMVDKYVRLSRLPEELKSLVKEGGIHPNPTKAEKAALDAVDGLRYTKNGPVPVERVIALAKELADTDISKADLVSEAKKGGSMEEIKANAAKKPKTKISIDLSRESAEKLKKVSESVGDSEKQRATQYVIDGVDKDYSQIGE